MQGCWCAGSRGWTRAGLNLSTSTSAWAAAGRIGKSLNIWRSCQPSVGRAGDGGLQSGWDASGRFLRSGNRVQPLENQAVGEAARQPSAKSRWSSGASVRGVLWRSFMQIAIRSDHFWACATPASEAENRAPLSSARFLDFYNFGAQATQFYSRDSHRHPRGHRACAMCDRCASDCACASAPHGDLLL